MRDGPLNDSTSWTKEGRPQSEEAVPVNVFMSKEHFVKFITKLGFVRRHYMRH